MPDLGAYAASVLGAYAVSTVLIGGLILRVWHRASRARAALDRVERDPHG